MAYKLIVLKEAEEGQVCQIPATQEFWTPARHDEAGFWFHPVTRENSNGPFKAQKEVARLLKEFEDYRVHLIGRL